MYACLFIKGRVCRSVYTLSKFPVYLFTLFHLCVFQSCLSVYLSKSVYLSVCLSRLCMISNRWRLKGRVYTFSLPVYLSVCLIYIPVCMSICLRSPPSPSHPYLSVLSICLPVCVCLPCALTHLPVN